MLWRSLMPASVTGRFPPCMARSSIAVTANLPLVVSLMVRSGRPIPEETAQLYVIRQKQSTISCHLAVAPAGGRQGAFLLRLERFNFIQNQFDTLVQVDAVIEQTLHRLGKRIVFRFGRNGIGGEPELGRLLFARLVLLIENDACGNADRGRPGRNVLHHHRVRADPRALAHGNRPEHLRASADDHPFAERRVALALVPGRPTERHAMIERAVVPELRGLADDHAHAVVDENPAADRRARVDLDPREEPRAVGREPPQPAQLHAPQRVRKAVDEKGMKARVAGNDLPGRARRGVAVEHAGYVFADSGKHRLSVGWGPVIIGNLTELVNYFPRGRSQAASMPLRILTSTFSSRARASRRRSRSMSLRGSRGCRKPLA